MTPFIQIIRKGIKHFVTFPFIVKVKYYKSMSEEQQGIETTTKHLRKTLVKIISYKKGQYQKG